MRGLGGIVTVPVAAPGCHRRCRLLLAAALAATGTWHTAALAWPVRAGLVMHPHFFALDGERKIAGRWGTLRVPARWDRAGAGSVQLTVGVISGRGSTPTYFIAGGPGGSAIGSFSGNAGLLLPLLASGDVVLVEQRGAGFSRPRLDCGERRHIPLDEAVDRTLLIREARIGFAACRRLWTGAGVDLAGYNTVSYARDLVAVADALGHRRLRIVAFSFGTQIALEVARRFPGRVAGAALLGVMGPGDALRDPRDHDAVLARVSRALDYRAYPDLVTLVKRASHDLRVRPLRVPLGPAGTTRQFVYDDFAFRYQLVVRLGMPSEIPSLPRFLVALTSDQYAGWLYRELRRRRLPGLRWMRQGPLAMRSAAQHYATICAAVGSGPREKTDAVLGYTFHPALPEACDAWRVPDLGPSFRAPPRTPVPMLLVSGEYDTKTPLEQAERLLVSLPNAVHYVVKGAGHAELLQVSQAVRQRIYDFFVSLER